MTKKQPCHFKKFGNLPLKNFIQPRLHLQLDTEESEVETSMLITYRFPYLAVVIQQLGGRISEKFGFDSSWV